MEVRVQLNQANQRCDRFLRKFCKPYPQVKLSDIYSWIRKGLIKVNGKRIKEEYRILENDIIYIPEEFLGKKNKILSLSQKEKKLQNIEPKLVKSWIIYEDEDRLVFDKPAGIVIHPSNKHWNDLCMNDYLEWYCGEKGIKSDATFKPSFGYRLDKDTSGVLIAAKNYETLQYINKIIRDKNISKEYLVIVGGKFPKHLIIDKAIKKTYNTKFDRAQMQLDSNDGLNSKTECWLEKSAVHKTLGNISLVRVKLYSGRMHQIRIHLSSEGFPVLGDLIYGKPALNRIVYKSLHIQRQLLHCWKYEFTDINGKNMVFQAPIPKEFILLP